MKKTAALLLLAAGANASQFQCQSDTFRNYIGLGSAGCRFGPDVFSDFAFRGADSALDAMGISPSMATFRVDTSWFDPNGRMVDYPAVALAFPAHFDVTDNEFMTFSFSYTVSVDPGYVIRSTGYDVVRGAASGSAASASSTLGGHGLGSSGQEFLGTAAALAESVEPPGNQFRIAGLEQIQPRREPGADESLHRHNGCYAGY